MDYGKIGRMSGPYVNKAPETSPVNPAQTELDALKQQVESSTPSIPNQVVPPTANEDVALSEAELMAQELESAKQRASGNAPIIGAPETGRGIVDAAGGLMTQLQERGQSYLNELMRGTYPMMAPAMSIMRTDSGDLDPLKAYDKIAGAATAGTLGASSLLNTTVEAVYDTILNDKSLQENWANERKESRQQRYERELRLDAIDNIENELFGGMVGAPYRIGKWLDDVAEGGERLMGVAKRGMQQGVFGGFEAALTDVILNGNDANPAVSGALGLVAGSGGQLVFGDGAPRLARWLAGGMSPAKANVGDIMFHTGSESAPFAPQAVPPFAKRLATEGTEDMPASIMTLTPEGMAPGELASRVADAIPAMRFPKDAGPYSLGAKRRRGVTQEALDNVRKGRQYLDLRVRSDVNNVVGGPTGDITTYSNFLDTEPKLAAPRAAYKDAFGGEKGATPIHYETELLPKMEGFWAKAFDGEIPADAKGSRGKAWKDFVNEIRPQHRTDAGASRINPLYEEKGLDRVDLGSVTLRQLNDVSQWLGARSKPGIMVNGTSADKQFAKANATLKAQVDELILDYVAPIGEARKKFAAVMQQRDDFEYGKDIARQMGLWEADDSKNVFEYLNSINDDAKAAVKAGFLSEYGVRLQSSPAEVLKSSFGDNIEGTVQTFMASRPKNEAIIRAVIGDPDADKLKAVTSRWAPMDHGMKRIEEELFEKTQYPGAQAGAESKMDQYYMLNMAMNPASGITLASPTGQGALARTLQHSGPATAAELASIIGSTDRDAAKKLMQIYNSYMIPPTIPMGGPAASLLAGSEEPNDESSLKDYITKPIAGTRDALYDAMNFLSGEE